MILANVIIPAAGKGLRLGGFTPKQYLKIQGKYLIEHTLNIFFEFPNLERIVVVIAPDDTEWQSLPIAHHPKIVTAIGGQDRCHSVLNGLKALSSYVDQQDWILVHDAARPCLHRDDLHRLMTQLANHPVGGCLGIPIYDTLKRCDSERNIQCTVSRDHLWRVLTPQMFRYQPLIDALKSATTHQQPITDESSAIELSGAIPLMVPGRADNIKVTVPEDLEFVEYYLQRKKHENRSWL